MALVKNWNRVAQVEVRETFRLKKQRIDVNEQQRARLAWRAVGARRERIFAEEGSLAVWSEATRTTTGRDLYAASPASRLQRAAIVVAR